MTVTTARVQDIAPVRRDEAGRLAAAENQRFLDLARSLDDHEWTLRTECPAWDCRQLAAHVTGMAQCFSGVRPLVRQMSAATKASKAEGVPLVDALTARQVADRAAATPAQIVAELAELGPRSARWRRAFPGPLRRLPMKEEVDGVPETWRVGFLLDTILTRDTWMHRVDLSRATGREMVLSPEHDGRIVADVVAEWARRHGRPFDLELTGPAGGRFTNGPTADAERITLDAVEFCRILSGRATGTGLLSQAVPF